MEKQGKGRVLEAAVTVEVSCYRRIWPIGLAVPQEIESYDAVFTAEVFELGFVDFRGTSPTMEERNDGAVRDTGISVIQFVRLEIEKGHSFSIDSALKCLCLRGCRRSNWFL